MIVSEIGLNTDASSAVVVAAVAHRAPYHLDVVVDWLLKLAGDVPVMTQWYELIGASISWGYRLGPLPCAVHGLI